MRPNVRMGIKPCSYIFHLPYRNTVSFLESGLTFVSTVKPDSRKDTEDGEEVLSHKRYDSALRR